jgi:glycosyltransferase involved in cell wall biosynthesis
VARAVERSHPLRVVIDVRRLGDFGIGTYIRNLVRAISEIDQESEYTLIARAANVPELEGLGPNFKTAIYDRADTEVLHNITFPQFLRQFSADLYHIPLNSVAYWMPKPYVLTLHDMSTLLFRGQGNLRQTLHQERYRRGAARAARIIAVSNATRRDVEAVLQLPSDRLTTIYSAPDPAFADQEADPVEDQRVLDRYSIRPPFILYAGAIRPQKNIPRLVDAFAVLRNELKKHTEYCDLRLVIIGDDLSKSPAVRRAVISARLGGSVKFLGFVPIHTLKVFYRAATVFAFPSLYEGFGLAPLEAMSCGTPVVSSNLPALMEAVGDAAELVSPDNVFDIARGLRTVLLDDQRRAQLREAGKRHAGQFNWRNTARSVVEIYHEIR